MINLDKSDSRLKVARCDLKYDMFWKIAQNQRNSYKFLCKKPDFNDSEEDLAYVREKYSSILSLTSTALFCNDLYSYVTENNWQQSFKLNQLIQLKQDRVHKSCRIR